MTTVATVRSELRDLYARESAAIEQEFSVTGEGRSALARRTALVDSIVQRLWKEIVVSSHPDSTDSGSSPAAPDARRISLWWQPADTGAAGFSPTPISICCFCTPGVTTPKMNSKIHPALFAGGVGPAAEAQSRHAKFGGVRTARSEQC